MQARTMMAVAALVALPAFGRGVDRTLLTDFLKVPSESGNIADFFTDYFAERTEDK